MPKKILLALTVALLTVFVWIYRTSSFDHNMASILIDQNYYMYDTLIQPHPSICRATKFIIIVTSYIGHIELRSAHRRALSSEELQLLNITRIFLLAKLPTTEKYITQEAIADESNTFGDILQGAFYEHYRNLTHKHLMGLHWASTYCENTPFILKVDDDTVFNIDATYKFITNISKTDNNLIMGYILKNTRPRRNKQNKWFVTSDEFSRTSYPNYVSGWYYIIHTNLAARICEEAKNHPYFWIDDILVTGILTESLNIKLRQLPKNYWLEYYELLECCLRDMVTKYIRCDYVVGPNGGRNNLIVEFNEGYKHCMAWNNCTSRLDNENLNNHCIMNKDRTIFSDGRVSEIKRIKLK